MMMCKQEERLVDNFLKFVMQRRWCKYVCLCCCYLLLIIKIAATEYNYFRLPNNVRPVRYKLRILTDLENPENLTFMGDVSIQLKVLHRTRNVTLHAQKLEIDKGKLRLEALNARQEHLVIIKRTERIEKHDYFVIRLSQNLKRGVDYILTIPFRGKLNSKLRGYYVSSYQDSRTGMTRYLAVTQFEPASARAAFPCFDEPNKKATFTVILGHHIKYQALSNMPLKEKIPMIDRSNWEWSIFEESVPMSTYLVAYSVNEFVSTYAVGSPLGHVKFNTWARPDAISQCLYAGDIGPKLLSYYEQLFDIKFPLAKIDQIALPDFSAGAMENWGLVTYRETALLFSEHQSSLSDKQRVAIIIAHELAHQWFGNLVTMKWWTDLWLNEGFATYISSLGVEFLHPQWYTYDEESLENTHSIFNLDALNCSHPVSQRIERVNQISEIFDSISYKKGSAVIRMMHMFLGDDTFRTGLKLYLIKHAFSNAEQNDLWESLSEAAHNDRAIPEHLTIKTIMDSWTLQIGYPIVNVIRHYATGKVELSQTRFMQDPNINRDNKSCWYVPLSYTTEGAADFTIAAPKLWLECDPNHEKNKSYILTLPNSMNSDEWVIFNVQLSGLYRINYDEKNWQLIIKSLNSNDYHRIHVLNRAQVIDDALNLAWSGQRDYNVALDLLEYLRQEREYMPWRTALENLGTINRILRQTPEYEPFQEYMRFLLLPIYQELHGLNASFRVQSLANEQPNALLHKVLIAGWACRFDMGDCVSCAMDYYEQWRSSDNPDLTNIIPNDLRTVVYCTAMRYGSQEDWQFLWERFQNSNVAGEKRIIISALGCTREVWMLNRYLGWAFDSSANIRHQDASFVFAAIARGEIGYHLARDFFFNNIEYLSDFYEMHSVELSRLLAVLASQMSNPHDYEQLNNFVNKHNEILSGNDQSVRRALETVEINARWRKRHLNNFTRYLRERFW